MGRRNRTVFIGLGAAVLLAICAWVAGAQIKSPAQIAAETAAPDPSSITVPVERRVLSSEIIVRGTVRYGSPQPVVLATSTLKQSSSASGGTDIVTTRPRSGARVGEGKPRHVGLRTPRVRAARRAAVAPGHPARQPRAGRAPARDRACSHGLLPRQGRRPLRRCDRFGRGALVRARRLDTLWSDGHPARPAARGKGGCRCREGRVPAGQDRCSRGDPGRDRTGAYRPADCP